MQEKQPPPPPPPPDGPPPPRRPPASPTGTAEIRIAMKSKGFEVPLPAAWILTAALVLAGGFTFYALRGGLAAALDGLLPSAAAPAVEEPVPAAAAAAPPPAAPSAPVWTPADVAAVLEPLPARAEALVAAGRGELPAFRDLTSRDRVRLLQVRNQWQAWGVVWRNRLQAVGAGDRAAEGLLPLAECPRFAELAPTCGAVAGILATLDRVPEAADVAAAGAVLDEASAALDALLRPPEEETEAAGEAATNPP